MKEIKNVYVLVNNDDLELPLLVCDTLEEIFKSTGFNVSTLFMAIQRNSVIAGKYRLRKVDICEPEDKFNDVKGYIAFCKQECIKPTYFTSLVRYRQYCYGV